MLRNRLYSEDVLDNFLKEDAAWRASVDEGNSLRKIRNEASLRISKLNGHEKAKAVEEMKTVATRIGELDITIADLEMKRDETLLLIPNIPDVSVPVGDCYEKNVIVTETGKVRQVRLSTQGPHRPGRGPGHHRFPARRQDRRQRFLRAEGGRRAHGKGADQLHAGPASPSRVTRRCSRRWWSTGPRSSALDSTRR